MKKITFLLLAVAFTALSCNDKYPDLGDGLFAEIVTDKGTMVAELFYEDAPATIANFVSLAEGTNTMVDSAYAGKPFYNGLKFHRIIKDFMIQGGDPLGTGSGNPGYKFHDEFSDKKHDTLGMLSMANSGVNTNGSQFFITEKPTPWLDGKHTVFGQVRLGFDTVEALSNVPKADERRGVPKEPVFIQEVNIIRQGSEAKEFNAPVVFTEELAKEEQRIKEEEAMMASFYEGITERFATQKAKAETLPSGLQVYWENRAETPQPKLGTMVKVDYSGYFTSGELFDTSSEIVARDHNKVDERRARANAYQPMETKFSPDAQLAPGFREGLLLLSPGDKVTLFIPSHLGYGERGYPGAIPPNSDLVFDLEMKADQ